MPCYQAGNVPAGYVPIGSGSYSTEADCLNACKEGACCNGTTCSVKPQCQCDESQGFGFQGVGTSCSPNPCNVGACCVGPTCYQNSEEQCEVGVNVGTIFAPIIRQGVFVGDNIPCSPNPCCPTCDPYVYNQQTNQWSGTCCRATYVDDGTGACCQTICCTNQSGSPASGAINGSCCPDSKPFCCTPTGGNGVFPNQRQCQSVPPTPCGLNDQSFSPCNAGTGRTVTFSVESGPFTARVFVSGARLRIGQSRVHETDPLNVTIDYGEGEVPLPGTLDFCKPNGVATITVRIGAVMQYIGPCNEGAESLVGPECDCFTFTQFDGTPGGTPVNSPSWSFSFVCLNGCDCNPLP